MGMNDAPEITIGVDGERSPASIHDKTSLSKRVRTIFFVMCVALMGLFLLYHLMTNINEKRELAQREAANMDVSKKVEQTLAPLKVVAPPEPQPVEPPPVAEVKPERAILGGPQPALYAPPPPASTEKPEPTPQELAEQRKLAAPVSFSVDSSFSPGGGPPGNNDDRHGSSDGALAAQLVGTATPLARARSLGNRNFLLTKGTFIEAVMETAMSSDLPGMVRALVTTNVYGSNGKVVLLERGTRLVGEFKGQLQNGQARVFVLWTRAETPKGVVINLDSGAADALGRSGVDGYIDNHWGLRLGAALLLSIWSDGMQILIDSQRDTKGDNNYITYDNSSRAAQDMASEALRQYINIPPTLLKNQGDPVRVFVARDLDFAGVYQLKANSPQVITPSVSVPVAGATRP